MRWISHDVIPDVLSYVHSVLGLPLKSEGAGLLQGALLGGSSHGSSEAPPVQKFSWPTFEWKPAVFVP